MGSQRILETIDAYLLRPYILTDLDDKKTGPELLYAMEPLVHSSRKHHSVKSGINAVKKEEKLKKRRGLSNKRYNPKAFGVSSVGKSKRCDQRNLDRLQRKEIVRRVDRTEEESPPPVCVIVMVC